VGERALRGQFSVSAADLDEPVVGYASGKSILIGLDLPEPLLAALDRDTRKGGNLESVKSYLSCRIIST
jgi:hypothetical protein